MGRTDHEEWKLRDIEEMRSHAEEWRDATTVAKQEDIFKKYGTRWSELWRLQYWNPVRQLVVDPMHALLEGNAHAHFRFVLQLTSVSANSPAPAPKAFSHSFQQVDPAESPLPNNMTVKEAKQVASIHTLLTAALRDDKDNDVEENLKELSHRLMNKNIASLQFVCNDLSCVPEPKPNGGKAGEFSHVYKKDWVAKLIQWVSNFILPWKF